METGKHTKRKKTKQGLLCELKGKNNYQVTQYMLTKQVMNMSTSKEINTEKTDKEMSIGWIGQPKVLLPVLG